MLCWPVLCCDVVTPTNAQLPFHSLTLSPSTPHTPLLHTTSLTPILNQLCCFSAPAFSLTMSAVEIARMSPTPSELVARTESPAPSDADSDSSSSGSSLSSEYSAHSPSPPPAADEPDLPGGQSPRAFAPETPMPIRTQTPSIAPPEPAADTVESEIPALTAPPDVRSDPPSPPPTETLAPPPTPQIMVSPSKKKTIPGPLGDQSAPLYEYPVARSGKQYIIEWRKFLY